MKNRVTKQKGRLQAPVGPEHTVRLFQLYISQLEKEKHVLVGRDVESGLCAERGFRTGRKCM